MEVDQANPLTRLVGFNLGTAYLRARRLFKKRMAALELSPLEYFILALVGGKSMHQARISGGLDIPMQNLTVLMERMEARDLVVRVRSERDRRAQVVRLSDPGVRLLRRARKIMQALERELLEPLSASERKIFRQLLDKLAGAAKQPTRAAL
ncbi:MAG: MarR family winged helix-turn-helix transcriptional regulator [Bryobacteraceae bacterium]